MPGAETVTICLTSPIRAVACAVQAGDPYENVKPPPAITALPPDRTSCFQPKVASVTSGEVKPAFFKVSLEAEPELGESTAKLAPLLVTALPVPELSVKNDPEVFACSNNLVFAVAEVEVETVKLEVYFAVPLMKWKFVI